MEKIAFIGTGVMGRSMAGHLLAAGHEVVVFNRTPSKAADLVDRGAVLARTPADAVRDADVVITMVGYPSDVEDLYLGGGRILDSAPRGALVVDMTTSSPALARRVASAAAERGLRPLDAPVSGGDAGARNATLSIMAGGAEADFEAALPVLSRMGKNIVLQGDPGSGQHCKMCNQIAIASGMMGVAEALAYAVRSGLDPRVVLSSIEAGAAGSWSLSNLAPRVLRGDLGPGFYVKHFLKDMGIALDSARELGLGLPGLEGAERLYRALAAMGPAELEAAADAAAAAGRGGSVARAALGPDSTGAELGTQALFLLYASGRA